MEQRKKECCLNDCTKRLIIIFCAGTRSVYHSVVLNVNGMRFPFCMNCEWQFTWTKWWQTKRRTHAIGDDVCATQEKKPELFSDIFFFRRRTQTYLALNQMRNAYIYISFYTRWWICARKWLHKACTVHLLLKAIFVIRWRDGITSIGLTYDRATTAATARHAVFPCRRRRAVGFWF